MPRAPSTPRRQRARLKQRPRAMLALLDRQHAIVRALDVGNRSRQQVLHLRQPSLADKHLIAVTFGRDRIEFIGCNEFRGQRRPVRPLGSRDRPRR